DPRNVPILQKNVKANGYENVTVVGKAVSDKNGKLKLFLTGTSDSNSIYEFSEGLPSAEVETVSLDEYFKKYEGKIDLVKMDIQGAEYSALLGMRGLIEKNPQMRIVAEFEPKLMRDCGFDPEKYLILLEELGFEIRNINEKKRKIGVESKEELLKNYSEAGDNTNLYCVKKIAGN
ncbi:MAG: FkbM family methyltransferase, partial [Candidatus Bilamarchaeaceae archaeon]